MRSSSNTKRGLGLLVVALAASVVLSGCVASTTPSTFTDVSLGTATAQAVLTAENFGVGETQTLEEYGVFYSTNLDDIIGVDSFEATSAHPLATIISQPGVKQVRYQTAYIASPGEVGTITVKVKNLTPGTTYFYRLYTIGSRDSNGRRYVAINEVGSHAVSNPTLKSLVKSKGTLSPSFSRTRYVYTNTISRATSGSRITVVPTLVGSSVKMKIGGGVWSGVSSRLVSVAKGHSKILTVQVTAPDGVVANYTITVKRK